MLPLMSVSVCLIWVIADEKQRAMLFFFFQAEDGIRDYKVTGVQTCALPICSTHFSSAPAKALPSKAFAHNWLLPPGREALAAKVQFDYVRKEAATVHAFEIGRASCRERV